MSRLDKLDALRASALDEIKVAENSEVMFMTGGYVVIDPPLAESHSSVTVVTSDMQIAKLSLHWTQLGESLGQVKLFSTSIIDPLVPQIFCLPKYVLLS
jgi:hypothetical protein